MTKLLSEIKSDKACALEEQHYIALDGLLREIHEEAELERAEAQLGQDGLRTILQGGTLEPRDEDDGEAELADDERDD